MAIRRSTSVATGEFLGQLVDYRPHVRPGRRRVQLLPSLRQSGIAAKAIDLQDAGEVAEMRFGPLALAIGSIDVGHHRRILAAPRSIVPGIGPELARLRTAAPTIEHWRCGLVGEQPLGSSQSLAGCDRAKAAGTRRPGQPQSARVDLSSWMPCRA